MSPADHADDAEECSKLHYFADKRQLPYSEDNAVHVYITKLWGNMLVLSLFFPCSFLTCERPMSPADHADYAEECSKLHYYADKRQLPHSGDYAVHVYTTKVWGYMLVHSLLFPCSFLALPLHVNGLCLPQISLMTQRNAASCIISQTKDSCLIVESCSSCLCNKAVREHAR